MREDRRQRTDRARWAAAWFALFCATAARAGDPYADITGGEVERHITALVQCSRVSRAEGDILWGRVAGHTGEKLAARYVKAVMDANGLTGRHGQPGSVLYEWQPATLQWWPTLLAVRLEKSGQILKSAMAKGFSAPTPEGGAVGPLVDIDTGDNLDAFDLNGKIALLRSIPTWSVYRHTAQEIMPQLHARGAAGAIIWIDQPAWPGDLQYAANAGDINLVWTPWVTVSRNEGLLLRRHAGEPVRLVVNADYLDDWTTRDVVGVLHGNDKAREYVLIMAHIDGYFDAANDNASGVAAMLAVMRHYAAIPRERRSRHIMFAATGGHHEGGLGAERLQQAMQTIMTNFFDRCPIIFNMEHLGSAPADRSVSQNPRELMFANLERSAQAQLAAWFYEGCRRYNIRILRVPWPELHGDGRYLIDTGVPDLTCMELFPWYHSSYDNLDHIRPDEIARVAKAYCVVIDKFVLGAKKQKRKPRMTNRN